MIAEIIGNQWAAHPLDAIKLMKHNLISFSNWKNRGKSTDLSLQWILKLSKSFPVSLNPHSIYLKHIPCLPKMRLYSRLRKNLRFPQLPPMITISHGFPGCSAGNRDLFYWFLGVLVPTSSWLPRTVWWKVDYPWVEQQELMNEIACRPGNFFIFFLTARFLSKEFSGIRKRDFTLFFKSYHRTFFL